MLQDSIFRSLLDLKNSIIGWKSSTRHWRGVQQFLSHAARTPRGEFSKTASRGTRLTSLQHTHTDDNTLLLLNLRWYNA